MREGGEVPPRCAFKSCVGCLFVLESGALSCAAGSCGRESL